MAEDKPKNSDSPGPEDDDSYPAEFLEPDEPWVSTGDWWLQDRGLFDEFLEQGASVPSPPVVPNPDPSANPYRDILLTPDPDDTPLENIRAELDAIERSSGGSMDLDDGTAAIPPSAGSGTPGGALSFPSTSLPGQPVSGPAASLPGAGSGPGLGTAATVAAGIAAAAGAAAAAWAAHRHKEKDAEKPEEPADTGQWFYLLEGQQMGPSPGFHIRHWISTDQIPADTQVWREGLPAWITAREAGLAPPAEVPPPAPPTEPAPPPASDADICQGCGELLQGNQFCPLCGREAVSASPGMNCPSCGSPREPAARFCSKCGQSLV